ncbi:Death-associated protein kinase related [Orchesella cincta]|uniref:Death-associated protein kinase related n=1 Tax=Orchesella cincta TaxID=48709 RepID=A0A1D2NC32_ORCCI|nr:Death-associated protein kinase related [Orchesella cincta]
MVINNCDPEEFPTLETTSCDSRGILKLNQNLIINKSVLDELYRVDKGAPFATGLYAQVRRCKSLRPTGSQKLQPYYAAKFSPRKRPGHSQNEDCVESLHEIALLCQLKNPYIISFKDAFILDDFIVTIMEFLNLHAVSVCSTSANALPNKCSYVFDFVMIYSAPGGDLQSVIDADLVLLEKDASRFVSQLLEALKYLHSRHIAHLDIKPQNLLLMGEFPSCDLKLCDFEISRVIRPGMEIREILGTPDYVAPEILLYEPLSTVCDMWSVGILTYVLLTGFSPFGGDTDQETFSNIINEPIDFPEELFEDVSPEAIDFIEKLAVKNGRTRPNAEEIELHDWVRSYVSPSTIPDPPPLPPPPVVKEPVTATISAPPGSPIIGVCGPKKRSPRKASAMSGSSTASVSPAGRRQSARSILRACKSAYDLNKMGGKTKSREVLIEKMRIATGEPSGGPWKLRKNLSKSREQLWESKIQLSKSCEKINNNLPGSSRWASVANFPSLDMNTMKSSTSQESVISVMSTCTNVGNAQQQLDLDWQQQQVLDDTFPYSVSMPNTPPVPNFDLSHNNGYHESSPPIMSNNYGGLQSKLHSEEFTGYPSLASSNGSGDIPLQYPMTQSQATSAAIEEAQRSVAELIMTFGGRVSKKLDLKNKFEPILEVDGSEEQPMSLGDCSDNNSTSGVSSIIPTSACPNSKEKLNEHNGKQFENNAIYGYNNKLQTLAVNKTDTGQGQTSEPGSANSSRRNSRTAQQIHDEMKTERRSNRSEYHNATSTRRGSMSPPKNSDGTTLKGILKKPKQPDPPTPTSRSASEFPGSSSARRGSIPSNCFRLYEQHTISSSAKAPKRSILKNGSTNVTSDAKLSKSTGGNHSGKSGSSDRSSSRSPENTAAMKNSPPKDKEDSPAAEGKNENVSSAPPSINNNNQNTTSINRQNRPTSILITSNADNKIDTLESPRRTKPSADFTSIVITPPEKVCEQEGKPIPNQEQSSEGTSTPGSSCDDTEPAAVAIKVFPPDPIIIPKSSILLLNSGKAPDSPVAEDVTSPSPMDRELKEFLKKHPNATPKQISRGMKSQWGVVCTGSVERAKGRFESVRSKLRRGSVPDF